MLIKKMMSVEEFDIKSPLRPSMNVTNTAGV